MSDGSIGNAGFEPDGDIPGWSLVAASVPSPIEGFHQPRYQVDTTPNAVLRGLVNDGPVQVANADEQNLAVHGSLIDHHTLHDALLIANHRVRGTDAIISNDEAFTADDTLWR